MYEELIDKAERARNRAYAPYSHFRVGAALLCSDREIYTGCNIENISYGATCCAERTAIFKAVSEGRKGFQCIAIVSDLADETFPCGICLQVMSEFRIPKIILGSSHGKYKVYSLGELLPNAFNSLERKG
ncbi:MAG: cytidine deaminase [Clostridiales bacterium]|nr:cytidine deaminase [Clostridiales bacterium]